MTETEIQRNQRGMAAWAWMATCSCQTALQEESVGSGGGDRRDSYPNLYPQNRTGYIIHDLERTWVWVKGWTFIPSQPWH
jgi:hypothetical protein